MINEANRESVGKALIFLSTLWLVAGLTLVTFYVDLAESLWLGAPIVQLGFFVWGVGMFVWACVVMRKVGRAAVLSAILSGGGLITLLTVGHDIGERIRFSFVRGHYERRVKEILAASPESFIRQKDCEIETGPPVRIAFVWYGGVIDNWVGLVYDPTGEVMKANAFIKDWSNWQDESLAGVKKMFGGDLVRAKRMSGNWYLCWFT